MEETQLDYTDEQLDLMLDFEIEELESRITFSNSSDGSSLQGGGGDGGAPCAGGW